MIEVRGLTKKFGGKTAVDDVSFTVRPGVVTGFLGPNGAGKTTTMRMMVGLDRPTAGEALIDGVPYRQLERPGRQVGTLLEARDVAPRRSARNHLRWIAAANGLNLKRVDEVLELVGLTDVADKAADGFSLGMSQRLGLASALLGDPEHLILDEPVNGLDPEGIAWVRWLLRTLAGEGRTVLVSSHLLTEMAQTAEDLIVIGRGRLIAQTTVDEIGGDATQARSLVRTEYQKLLEETLQAKGMTFTQDVDPHGRSVLYVDAATDVVGLAAYESSIPLQELTSAGVSLEEAFMELTGSETEYRGGNQ
ncbi:ABC transporter ATP-binding protein [Corynebacterium sp. TAE3-ERU12]|uniref:ABC transporter ATP-binding protein n=1 Tax=Corynebacterium sp. TAE3-ERU12 TaxID=2849491 RepID=UPI001C48E131|nr:ABC transporter ATP-binding protein [Corynebacterium sp. TAE3-ERU12]MBV7295970.1 ABC transporter ATP-binding protein [Corynebacterium sp. TAE3-ERU12]